ncbi:hypothetical protein GE061_011858 [Apolygus lucorum]|uniref:CHK kinase-like domain-containing protein n=1 Tax=Apolygus lucorum TaxID=248454 RepID=A0A8S9XTC3_APOLU|nr:hypothetical protein GE061_011858 [Apolygus lucorum]
MSWKKKDDKPTLSPLEIALRDIAVADGVEGIITVKLRTETYPPTSYFTFFKFDVTGENKALCMLVKVAQQDADLRNKFFVREKYLNEVTFYSQCVPKIRPILDKWAEEDPPREVVVQVPSYFGHDSTDGQEWLAIEDKGPEYVAIRNLEDLDKLHLKAAMQALASFHSACLAWKSFNPSEFATIARLFTETEMLRTDDDPAKDVKTQKIHTALGAANRVCGIHLSGPYSILIEKMYNSALVECPTWVSMDRAEPWSVITHGDCWAKNFLFKYDKNKKITGVAMVDFKCARAASPVLDVTNFLLSSGSADCLKDLRPFIEKHKDSMTPKMADYRKHVRLFGCYGVVASLVHHYYGVLYPNLDVEEATAKIVRLEDLKSSTDVRSEPVIEKSGGQLPHIVRPTRSLSVAKSPTKVKSESPKKDGQETSLLSEDATRSSRLRIAMIVRAAHDVRMI